MHIRHSVSELQQTYGATGFELTVLSDNHLKVAGSILTTGENNIENNTCTKLWLME